MDSALVADIENTGSGKAIHIEAGLDGIGSFQLQVGIDPPRWEDADGNPPTHNHEDGCIVAVEVNDDDSVILEVWGNCGADLVQTITLPCKTTGECC